MSSIVPNAPSPLVFSLFLLFSVCQVHSNLAPLPTQSPSSAPPICSSSHPESCVLYKASVLQDASIAQVISEDETAHLETAKSSLPTSDDAWAAAFNRWVNPEASSSKGAQRALEEARKRFAKTMDAAHESQQKFVDDLKNLDDDEATKITHYAQILAREDLPINDLLDALEEVELLCASGDNGRQMAAVGGIKVLIRLFAHMTVDVARDAMRALASCAQNNPSVFEIAVREKAIDKLVELAMGSREEVGIRAAALRALVALTSENEGMERLWERRGDVAGVVMEVVGNRGAGVNERRCLVRGLALAESCLRWSKDWKGKFMEVNLVEAAERAIERGDADVREGAARVLQMLR